MNRAGVQPIEMEFNCLGYYGFGGGVVLGRNGPQREGSQLYCATCPLRSPCWEAHRENMQRQYPGLVEEFQRLLSKHLGRGDLAVKEHTELHGQPDVYSTVMMGNIEDGCYVAATGKPKDRGAATLPYPFGEVTT
jgi:hypothetical protein